MTLQNLAMKNNGWYKKTTRNCFFKSYSATNNWKQQDIKIQQLIIENNKQDNTTVKYAQMLEDKKTYRMWLTNTDTINLVMQLDKKTKYNCR